MTFPTISSHPVRFRVLVVDDDPGMLQSISTVLGEDVDVVTCDTPHEALQVFRTTVFHVVCSDFKMPGMDGLELLRRVSASNEPVGCLLLTGSDEYSYAENNRHYVLLKPFDPERLIALVLQLARVTEMKRSVQLLSSTVRKEFHQ